MRQSIVLTVKEIINLCEFSGIPVDATQVDEDSLETEICVSPVDNMKFVFEQADGTEILREYTGNMAWYAEYPEEGVHPLGDEK